MKRRRLRRSLCALLCAGLLLSALPAASAADKALMVEQAQSLAVANSSDISKQNSQILLKRMQYVEAVKGIQAKVKNKKSFRWSPLLSFKFPQPLTMVEEYELNVKPLTLQAEIDTLEHQLTDLRQAAVTQANKLFANVYILQEKVSFTQDRLDTAQEELTRNQARLVTGDAVQADVDTMAASVKNLTTELSNLKREFQTAKEGLSDLIGMDVTTGYTFRNPLKQLSLPREQLDAAVQYTLDNDQTVYEARMSASTALMNLESYESLMRNQYGGKMNRIQTFINQAKQGQEVDYAAFQMAYNEFLKDIDRPWAGKIRIIFFTFTMEWFKGEIDGSRYIEDEMYAIYTACMEYANALTERESTEETIEGQVRSSYEGLVTAWNSYQNLASLQASAGETLEKVSALNKLGKAEYSEVEDARESYQDAQLEAIDALSSYNELLFDFDDLTCGYVSEYLLGAGFGTDAGSGGDSFAVLDPINDPYYYIYTTVDDLTFHLGVSIPEDFEPAITDFEVWIDGVQLGRRLPVGQELQHLTLDYGGGVDVTLRFYNGDDYVTECTVDATVPRDVLPLERAVPPEPEPEELGTFTVATTALDGLSTSALTLELAPGVTAETFTITYGAGSVYTSDPTPVDSPFTYLTLLIASLDDVSLSLYDGQGALTYTAWFDTGTQTILGEPAQ